MMAQDTEFTQIWEEAFAIYKEKTGRDIRIDPTLQSLHTTDDLLDQLDQREKRFESFRGKKSKLWSVLRSCMKPIELLGGLTQGALSLTPFAPASTILGAVLFLVGSAHGVSEAYDSIMSLLSQLEDFTGRLQEYTKANIDAKLRRKVTAILITMLEIFARAEKLIQHGRLKQYLIVTFLGSNEKVAAAMGRLKALVDTEEKLVVSQIYSTTQRTDNTVERTDNTVQRSAKTLGGMAASMSDAKRKVVEEAECQSIKENLEKTAVISRIHEINGELCDHRLPGSGEWIKEEPLFQAWMEKRSPILWILGGPGAGKSFLSSKIISYLEELYPQDPQHPSRVSVGYFYIKEDDQNLRSIDTILKSLAFQIANSDPVYRNYVASMCSTPEKISSPKGAWQHLYMGFFGSRRYCDSECFLVIDGLDEAPKDKRGNLITFLKDLENVSDSGSRPRIQIALVGRPELRGDINSVLDRRVIFIEVSAKKNSGDITNYISNGIHRVQALKNPHISIQDRINLRKLIIDKLTAGANGMFLWCNLVFDQIQRKSRPLEITAALNNAPRDLSNMIRHVFERLSADPDVDKEDLNEMLAWVACAQRPLSLGQMDTVLKLRPPIGEGKPDLEESLRGQFSSFFTLKREDGKTTEELERLILVDKPPSGKLQDENRSISFHVPSEIDGSEDILETDKCFDSDFSSTTLGFSHASIRDYLLQEGRPETRKWSANDTGVGIDFRHVQQHIVKTCLSILCNNDPEKDVDFSNLLPYAADHFMKHLVLLERSVMGVMEKRDILHHLLLIFEDDSVIERCFEHTNDFCETFIQTWLGIRDFSNCVRKWFTDDGALDDNFTPEQRLAMQKAGRSDTDLFRSMGMFCARKWLTTDKDYFDRQNHILFLHVYLALDEYRLQQSNGKAIDLSRLQTTDLSAARIQELAQFGDLEKTATWHTQLGRALRAADHVNAAVPLFIAAIKMDEQARLPKEGLSQCYAELTEYNLAIEWQIKAIELTAEEDQDSACYSWQSVAEWKLELNDTEGAIAASKKALSLKPEDPEAMYSYVAALDAGSHLEEILNFAMELEKLVSAATGETYLTGLLTLLRFNGPQEKLGNAARALGKLDFVLHAMENTVVAAERKKDADNIALQRMLLANFKFRHADRTQEAVQIWEDVLEITASKEGQWTLEYVQIVSSDQLCQVYYSEATAAHNSGSDPEVWISKLQNLSRDCKVLKSDDFVYYMKKSTLVLGLCYRLHNKKDKAKACFRASILQGLDILTDDDPENDSWGYTTLAGTLLMAGDKVNAAAAFSIPIASIDKLKAIQQAKRNSEEQPAGTKREHFSNVDQLSTHHPTMEGSTHMEEGTFKDLVITDGEIKAGPGETAIDATQESNAIQVLDSTEKTPQFPYMCDGECRRKVEDWTALYFCEVCLNTCFGDKCFANLQAKKLPFRICDPEHTFYQAYPTPEDVKEIAGVVVDGKVVPHKDWLQKLREEWQE